MSGGDDEDDKPTVVLDLNALKKQKLQQDEELANLASELEFIVAEDPNQDSEDFAEKFLDERGKKAKASFNVILFDFQSDFFQKSQKQMPKGYNYQIARNLGELNTLLRGNDFQVAVFNYDVSPKAVNQLSVQIKQKFPATRILIMARVISPKKAQIHAKTPSGAHGYYQFPIETEKLEQELQRMHGHK